MLRLIAFNAICFLAPFGIYALWRAVAAGVVPGRETWSLATIARLSGLGILLMIAGVVLLAHLTGGAVGTVYHPAEYKNGKLVPGGFE